MKKITYFALMLMIASLMFSCKKKKDPEPTPAQKILGKWKYISATLSGGGSTVSFDPCDLDNTLEFKTGDVLLLDEGPTKCDPSDPQTITTRYTLNSTGSTLYFVVDPQVNNAIVFDVLELTNKKLRLKASFNNNSVVLEWNLEKM